MIDQKLPDQIVDVQGQVERYFSTGRDYVSTDVQRASALVEQGIALASVYNYPEGVADGEIMLGRIEVRLGHYDISMKHYTRAAALGKQTGDAERTARAFLGIGYLYSDLGEYVTAQEYFMRGYEQVRGMRVSAEAVALNNLGNNHLEMGDYGNALIFLSDAIILSRELDDPETLSAVLDSLADLHLRTKSLEKALEYAQESVSIARLYDPEVGDNLITLGRIYLEQRDYDKALILFEEAGRVSHQTLCFRPFVRAGMMMGVTRRLQGKAQPALAALQGAYQAALKENNPMFQYECLFELSKTYKEAGNYQLALEYFEKYHALKEDVFNERSNMRSRTVEALHQLEDARRESELYQLRTVELQHEIEERMRAESVLEDLASHDSLTGLYNRRQFYHMGDTLLEQATPDRVHSLIVFDVDKFKAINDTYGHLTGDYVLKTLASQLPSFVRKVDVVARLGGDEFAIFLPDTDSQAAFQVAERLRKAVESTEIYHDGFTIRMTLSLGITESRSSDMDVDPVFARADKGLYKAKQAGRNQAKIYTGNSGYIGGRTRG
jgi:diguanylate cyclase (GGDEF)-like protein